MQVSIIVPVFNEALLIRPFLSNLRERTAGAEIIVVDGASTDATDQLAQGFCDQVIRTGARSRAKQMNVGTDAAHGDILWFVHADAEVPLESLNEIGRIMRDPEICGGFFRIRLPAAPAVYRLTDGFAHYAGLLLRMRCGDHGMFCRRTAFREVGGFPDVPLMEDVEFFRRLRCWGPIVHSKPRERNTKSVERCDQAVRKCEAGRSDCFIATRVRLNSFVAMHNATPTAKSPKKFHIFH